jgi:glycosyltransferase involved in cell wall biosynthesis
MKYETNLAILKTENRMRDLISIIIPIYNRAHIVSETLDSIIAQTYCDWECIIVDDGSTDDTMQVIKNYSKSDKRFIIYKRPLANVKGPSSCRNFGIEKANGQFIQFFDSDDIMHPNHLNLKIASVGNRDFVTCKVQLFTNTFEKSIFGEKQQSYLEKPKDPLKSFLLEQFPMCSSAPMWEVNFLKKHLPIREDLHILEDREFHARILSHYPSFSYLPDPLIYYRRDLKSSTNDFFEEVDTGIISFLEALGAILKIQNGEDVKLHILKKVLVFFRKALDQRNLKAAQLCLDFTHVNNLWYSKDLKMKRFKILTAFSFFKILKKGNTKFKYFFKV